jgi:hypothetical protein
MDPNYDIFISSNIIERLLSMRTLIISFIVFFLLTAPAFANNLSVADIVERGIRTEGIDPGVREQIHVAPPKEFIDAFGDASSDIAYAWYLFYHARNRSIDALSKLSDDDRKLIRDFNAVPYYNGFADLSLLKEKVDLQLLAQSSRDLAWAATIINANAATLAKFKGTFNWEDDGVTFTIDGTGDNKHEAIADFFIDISGNDTYTGSTGGNVGERPASLLIDLSGDDNYQSEYAGLGTGYLGIGGFIDLSGNDTYFGKTLSGGTGFFGAGFLIDLSGNDSYDNIDIMKPFYGCGLWWDQNGDDKFGSTCWGL